jgi:chromate transporter
MSAPDLLDLFARFALLSLLAVGGAMATAPEMHRYLVVERGWLDDARFTDSIALAQVAPGPNVLFVTLLGWQAAGLAGALATTLGMMLPSGLATWMAWRWKRSREDAPLVAALRTGLSPLAIGLTASAAWVVAGGNNRDDPRLWALTAVATVLVWRTRIGMLWLIGAGALLGALGWVG